MCGSRSDVLNSLFSVEECGDGLSFEILAMDEDEPIATFYNESMANEYAQFLILKSMPKEEIVEELREMAGRVACDKEFTGLDFHDTWFSVI